MERIQLAQAQRNLTLTRTVVVQSKNTKKKKKTVLCEVLVMTKAQNYAYFNFLYYKVEPLAWPQHNFPLLLRKIAPISMLYTKQHYLGLLRLVCFEFTQRL